MDMIKKIWPTPFKIKEKDVNSLVVTLIVFIVVCAIVGLVIGLLAKIPLIGLIFGLIGALVELYGTIGIVLCILVFCGVIKE